VLLVKKTKTNLGCGAVNFKSNKPPRPPSSFSVTSSSPMLSRNASFDSKSSVNQNSPIRASDTKWSPLHVTPPVSPFRTGSFSRSYPKLELSRKRSASENVPIPPCEASQLLEFRKFLPPELSCDIVTTAIMEYAEPHRFGVVCKPETSKEDTEKMVMRFYGVTIEADTTTNTIQTAKYWSASI